jgi:uncharacterized membrane protein YqaE (UPF0057 family)
LSIIALCSCNSAKFGAFNNNDNRRPGKPASATAPEGYAYTNESSTSTNSITSFEPASDKIIITSDKPCQENNNIVTDSPKKLSKEQKQQIKKDIREAVKKTKQNDTAVSTVLLVILAILLPPLAVALKDGIGGPFVLSIFLTLLFWIPGVIYALWRVLR